MRYGLIFSAGKETRFMDEKPKCLSTIKGKCLLDHNIEILEHFCDVIFVICSTQNQCFFAKYNKIVIESGKGCGDAVLQALQRICFSEKDSCIILWGDCIAQRLVCARMVENFSPRIVTIPCYYEDKPYVRLSYRQKALKVEFGKYGEVHSSGFHDFGLFLGSCMTLSQHLHEFASKITNVDGKYHHKHGDEMQFLDLFNETKIQGKLLEIKDLKPLSFNTKEELHGLEK